VNKLVTTLEAQHRALERIVGEVDVALASKDPTTIADRLRRLKSTFEVHLALENAQFYPTFQAERARAQASAEVAQMFAQNMKLIGEGLSAFFTRYAAPPQDLARFEREWRSTVTVLGNRIAAEEHTLHPMFEALAN
jgi:hypothetical protein